MKPMIFIPLLLYTFLCAAQRGNAGQKAAIQKLSWMTGNWMGRSNVLTDNNHVTNIRESVQLSLDGTIMQISVRATDYNINTKRQSLAYTSFSVISYDLINKRYRWTSWRTNENDYEEETFTVGNHSFEYVSRTDGKQVRYKGNLNTKGEFIETGEFSKDGSSGTPFITMRLVKSK